MKKQLLLVAIAMLVVLAPFACLQNETVRAMQDPNRTTDARSGSNRSNSGQSSVDSSDRRFVTEAAESSMSEIRQGQLASERASNEKVKQFAQQMVQDHTKANQELMSLAANKGITIPQDAMMSDSQHSMRRDGQTSTTGSQTSSQTTGQRGTQSAGQSSGQTGSQTSGQSSGQTGSQTSGQTSAQSSGQTTGQTTQKQSGMYGKDQTMMDRMSRYSGAEFDREYMRQQVKDHEKAVDLFQKQADKGKDPEIKAWASKMLPALREHQRMAREIATTVGVTDKSGKNP
jgi:predicted outer membrane protein